MKFAVTVMRRDGVRLTREELAATPPVVGDLEIEDWPEGNAARRILRQAQLFHVTAQYRRSVAGALFDPIVLRMTGRWFILRGFEFRPGAEGGRSAEHVQEWLVRPAEEGRPYADQMAQPITHPHQG